MLTEGMTMRQVVLEMVQIADVKNCEDYKKLRQELKKAFDEGRLSDNIYLQLDGCLQQWGREQRKKWFSNAIINDLKPEFQELIKAVGCTPIYKYSEEAEVLAIYSRYGGRGRELFSLEAALNYGFMKGVRAERKRRKTKA